MTVFEELLSVVEVDEPPVACEATEPSTNRVQIS